MAKWRVIITDTERATGVAPVCEQQDDCYGPHGYRDDDDDPQALTNHVFDCCPHPHIEAWSESAAHIVAAQLTGADAEVCS